MAKKKMTVEEALTDFAKSLNDAVKILIEDLGKITAANAEVEEDEGDEAPAKTTKTKAGKKEKPSKSAASKKGAVEDDEEDDEDETDVEEDEEDDEEVAPKKGKKAKAEKPASKKGKKAVEEDDEDEEGEDDEEDDEDEIEYSVIQKAVVKAAKAHSREFVAETLKAIGGKKCDHASKLKPEQYESFLEALAEGPEEDEEDDE